AVEDFVTHADEAARVSATRHHHDPRDAGLMVEALITRLGESVSRMEDEFIEDHPDLALRLILGTQNLASHGDGTVNHQALWNAIDRILPATVHVLRAMIR
ncbi:MAG: hypothetical protein FWD59_10105, partial [Micrococcales bacterium]|nr:hypothetical protein [Micrococcales bacterium]